MLRRAVRRRGLPRRSSAQTHIGAALNRKMVRCQVGNLVGHFPVPALTLDTPLYTTLYSHPTPRDKWASTSLLQQRDGVLELWPVPPCAQSKHRTAQSMLR